MNFALSTCYFRDASSGEEIVHRAKEFGFDGLELGYALKENIAEGILPFVERGEICVRSLHAFSPVTNEMQIGHPELFSLANLDEDKRKEACGEVLRSMYYAKKFGADTVVLHAGRVASVAKFWQRYLGDVANEKTDGWFFRRRERKMYEARAKDIDAHFEALITSLDVVLPYFEKENIRLALENLPSFDAFPLVSEYERLFNTFDSKYLCAWYDIGHGQVMENAGFGKNIDGILKLRSRLAGVHIHDVSGPAGDHHAPGTGGIDFAPFAFLADDSFVRVFEPSASITEHDLMRGLGIIKDAWKSGKDLK